MDSDPARDPMNVDAPGQGDDAQDHLTYAPFPAVPVRDASHANNTLGGHKRKPTSIHTAITAGFVPSMTPPLTPRCAPEDMEAVATQQSLFHNYLRALHDFDPVLNATSGDDEASPVTAKLKTGDLILVHCIHANGWADGTVLNTGERAWLPTNYCEGYDHPYLRNLLNAMTQFWDLLGAGEDANLSTFVRQDYIRGLIAGVRYLLERADCLHRDVSLVKTHAGVRRMRKGLLADLSSLVQIAKRLQETISEPFAGEVIHVLLEDLVTKACKVVTRAVSFVDVWTQETSRSNDDLKWLAVPKTASKPSADGNAKLAIDTKTTSKDTTASAVDSAKALPDAVLTTHTEHPTAQPTSASREAGDRLDVQRRRSNRISTRFSPPDGVAAHRVSLIRRDMYFDKSAPLASDQLAKAHDVIISNIAAFIGQHAQCRPCSELVATTDRLVRACRDLLAIVEEICMHDPSQFQNLEQVKSEFEVKVEELAKSTQDVFKFSDSPDDEVMMPAQSSRLVQVGTGLIYNTGECVVKTREVIQQIGDFQLKSWVVASPTTPQEDNGGMTLHARSPVESTEAPSSPPKRVSLETKRFSADKRVSVERRLSRKMLPPPPPPPVVPGRRLTSSEAVDSTLESPVDTLDTPITPASLAARKSLPPPPVTANRHRSATRISTTSTNPGESLKSPQSMRTSSISPARKDSIGQSISGSTDTIASSVRDSSLTARSHTSTRATTPDQGKDVGGHDSAMISSFASVSDLKSLVTDDSGDAESQLLQKTYANELTLKEDGQVSGGSLPALVEQLTTHDSAPDPIFVTTFYITFRKFCEPREFAQALIARFDYIGDGKTVGMPVRLRVYNVFKHWLETYWNPDADKDALGEIRYFALHKLKQHLPSAGERLIELTRRVTAGYRDGTLTGPLVSGIGKTSMSIGTQYENETSAPEPIVNKNQLNALRVAVGGGAQCNILDFDPLELARQITLVFMKTFCEIRADELLSMDWNKSNTKKARNVRQMCLLNTDLANFVGDTILAPEDAKKRATLIKHWAKVATACLQLNNYDSVMSIMCSINSSVVRRLKRTWELVSKKTKAKLEELDQVCDMSMNYTALRTRLATPVAPCLPFLGIYLTDLTFVIAGNQKSRQLPGTTSDSGEPVSVINFDMHMRIAKIITHLQKFQVTYKLKDVPEMQKWIEGHLQRMRDGHDQMVSTFHRRSLYIEPKQIDAANARKQPMVAPLESLNRKQSISSQHLENDERPKTSSGKSEVLKTDRFDFFLKSSAFHLTSRTAPRQDLAPIPDAEEPPRRGSTS